MVKLIKKSLGCLVVLFLLSFTVNAACSIVLNSPVNDYYTLDLSEDFNITVTGTNETYTGTLFLNGISASDETCLNATSVVFTNNFTASIGTFDWYVYAIDADGVNCTSAVRSIRFGAYKSPAIDTIGNLAHDFGVLFKGDMIDLVIGALVLGMIVFFGALLMKYINKSI